MLRYKRRVIAFLLLVAVICAFADLSIYQSLDAFAGVTDSQPSDTKGSFAESQPYQVLTDSYDNSQFLRLCSSEIRELAGRRGNAQSILLSGQEISVTARSLSLAHRHVNRTAFGNGRLSVLALSLGGNSPPVHHA